MGRSAWGAKHGGQSMGGNAWGRKAWGAKHGAQRMGVKTPVLTTAV